MPLIRDIKAFFDRRMQPAGPRVDRSPDLGLAGAGGETTAVLWVIVAVVTPFVGLVHEAVVRVDSGRRLRGVVPWAMAVVIGVAVVVALAWWFFGRS